MLLYLQLYCMKLVHTHTHTQSAVEESSTHAFLSHSKPWIYRAALKIKFLLQIIFLVIRKYTCSQAEECSDAAAKLTIPHCPPRPPPVPPRPPPLFSSFILPLFCPGFLLFLLLLLFLLNLVVLFLQSSL